MSSTTPVARRVEAAAAILLGAPVPLRFRTWDGSTAGPADAPVVVLRSPNALRRLLWSPGELGLARAYVAGDLDVEGDLRDALAAVRAPNTTPALWTLQRGNRLARAGLTVARLAADAGALGRPPAPPAGEARLRGLQHSRGRDRDAIAHHYDLSNDFYRLILDPEMVYSCGYWTADRPDYTLADAQRDKLDLICRKLRMGQGMRLLDVGCGWGALAIHAAREYGVRATAITLSTQQWEHATNRIAELGLGDRVDIRRQDYREHEETGYDAVASVEMGEHVGDRQYPAFLRRLRDRLRPGGRLLLQQMSRGRRAPGGGAFIGRYIAPDMHMRPVSATMDLVTDAGLEVSSIETLREHYVRTARAWAERLEAHWEEAVRLIGSQQARVWRLYLAGSRLAFEHGRMSVHQILAVRAEPTGIRPDTQAAPAHSTSPEPAELTGS